ncbi:hypothetical protein JCM15765_31390 [Paradesulfitobacterium aromaticivorans]
MVKKFFLILVVVLTVLVNVVPTFAQTSPRSINKDSLLNSTPVKNNSELTEKKKLKRVGDLYEIYGKVFDIADIPVIEIGKKYEIKDLSVYKQTINGKTWLTVFRVQSSNKDGYNIQDVYNSVNYVIDDYYDGTYMGSCELDTWWYTSNGIVTGIYNHAYGTVPDYQWPDYWSLDDSDKYIIPGDPTHGYSYAYLTDHYEMPGGWPVGYSQYKLETSVNGVGGAVSWSTLVDRL